jgi:hypothetical protein
MPNSSRSSSGLDVADHDVTDATIAAVIAEALRAVRASRRP